MKCTKCKRETDYLEKEKVIGEQLCVDCFEELKKKIQAIVKEDTQ